MARDKNDNEKILVTTSTEGKTGVMVCKKESATSDQGTCKTITNDVSQNITSGNNRSAMYSTRAAKKNQEQSQGSMLNNVVYDLMEQLLTENQSLWHIRKHYKEDAANDIEIKQLWDFIEKDKQELVQLLTGRLKERL